MPLKDQLIPAGEEWYYELDGRAHGPMRWSDLEELLGRAGETAAQVRVRKGADGPWSAFRSGGRSTVVSGSVAPAAERFERSHGMRPVAAGRWEGIGSFFQQHRELSLAAGVWILVNVLFLVYWPQPYAKERRYLATLQDVLKEVDDLRASGAATRSGAASRNAAGRGWPPLIVDLKKSASSSELPRQQLLWSSRPGPKIMGPRTTEGEQDELRLKQYLQSVEQAIGPP